jgi:hypothetical protein
MIHPPELFFCNSNGRDWHSRLGNFKLFDRHDHALRFDDFYNGENTRLGPGIGKSHDLALNFRVRRKSAWRLILRPEKYAPHLELNLIADTRRSASCRER